MARESFRAVRPVGRSVIAAPVATARIATSRWSRPNGTQMSGTPWASAAMTLPWPRA